jgi:hypothetical protein
VSRRRGLSSWALPSPPRRWTRASTRRASSTRIRRLASLGTFDPTASFTSQYIGVIATGYYFDEVTNATSDGTITLYAYSDLSAVSVLNVNLLTTLAYQRIRNLVANNGMTFAAAEAQAENEVLAAFSIHNPSGYGTFSTLDLSKGTDGDNILAALSSIFLYGNTSGNTAALIASVQSDIGANGAITNSGTQTQLLAAAQSVDADAITIAANLTGEYASEGISFSATNITDWIDQDGDGLTGRFKFNALRSPQASTFAFPLYVTDPWAGTSLSISAGQLYLNGTAVTGPITPTAGDEVSVGPPAGFSAGVLTVYLVNGRTNVGRVTFYGHGTWSPAANMITPRGGFAAAMFPNGTVLVVGGCPLAFPGGPCTSVSSALPSEIYNPATDSWTAAATEPTIRTGATATLLTSGPNAGQVLVVGGWVYSGGSLNSAAELTAELYDPATDSWAPGATLSAARASHTATLLANGNVLAVGGEDPQAHTPIASCELYDATSNSWSTVASLAQPLMLGSAVLLPNGDVLAVTGYSAGAGGGTYSSVAELYDPNLNTWSSAGTLITLSAQSSTTPLGNGEVLVAGGLGYAADATESITAPLLSKELYSPSANSWTPAAELQVPLDAASSLLLADGDVLVFGNTYNAAGTMPTWSPQLYDPVAMIWSSAAGSYSPPNIPGQMQIPGFQFADGVVFVLTGSLNLLYWQ